MSMIESQPAAVNRNKIIQHVEVWKTKLGSYAKVAQRCGVNEGGLSRVLSGTYGADERNMLVKLAKGLDYRETSWHMVREVGNYKAIAKVVHDAKAERMWFGISNKAGSGKTGTLEDIYNQDTTDSVVFLQAEEWSARQFIVQLVRKTVGASQLKGKYKPIAELLDLVANYFNEKSLEAPVLIIDEADKLKPAALRLLIPLYNKTEDRLGLVLSGTENLSKEMERGVKHAKKGYDELDSRLGRNYITLKGATEQEVYAICAANGVRDAHEQLRIWGEAEKVKQLTKVKTATGIREVHLDYVEDFRRIKRMIKRSLLQLKAAS